MLRPAFICLAMFALAASGCASKQCDGTTCDGCCDPSGTCRIPSASFCGVSGAACTTCIGADVCTLGVCTSPGGTSAAGGSNATNTSTSTGGSDSSTSTSGSSGSTSTTGTTSSNNGSSSSSGSTTSSTTTSNGSSGSSTGSTCDRHLYGLTYSPDAGTRDLREINPADGTSTLVGQIPWFPLADQARAVGPSGNLVIDADLDDGGFALVTIALASGNVVNTVAIGYPPISLVIDASGQAFGLVNHDGGAHVEQIDLATGATTNFAPVAAFDEVLYGHTTRDAASSSLWFEGMLLDGGYALANVDLASGDTTLTPLDDFDDLLWISQGQLYGVDAHVDAGSIALLTIAPTGSSAPLTSIPLLYVQSVSDALTPDGHFDFIGYTESGWTSGQSALVDIAPSGEPALPVPLDASYAELAAICR